MNRFLKSVLFVAVACLISAAPLQAATVTWDNGAGDLKFTNPINWSTNLFPTTADAARINNGTTAILDATAPNTITALNLGYTGGTGGITVNTGGSLTTTAQTYLGYDGLNGTLSVTGGTLTLGNAANDSDAIYVGYTSAAGSTAATGTYYQSGGTVTNSYRTYVGWNNGDGSFTLDGGTYNCANTFYTAWSANSSGSLTVNGGTLNTVSWTIGTGAPATFNMTNGTINASSNCYLGHTAQGTGTMSGGIFNVTGRFCVGYTDSGNTTFNMTGGTINKTAVGNEFAIGYGNNNATIENPIMTMSNNATVNTTGTVQIGFVGAQGTLNMSTIGDTAPQFNVTNPSATPASMNIGNSNGTTTYQSQGTVNMGGHAAINLTQTQLRVGMWGNSSGVLNMSGHSALNLTGQFIAMADDSAAGTTSTGTVTMTENATATLATAYISVGTYPSGTGTVHMGLTPTDNPTFTITGSGDGARIYIGYYGGVGTWNQNAGTTSVPAVWMASDCGGNTPTGSGTLNLNGGTLITTWIRTRDSQSMPATINFNGGTLQAKSATTDFISNDGLATMNLYVKAGGAKIDTNTYDVKISLNLQTDPAIIPPTLDGGVTKSGAGTLTLSGINTYTGTTTVNAGALAADEAAGFPTVSFLDLNGGVLQAINNPSFTRSLGTSGTAFQWAANGGGFSAGSVALNVQVNGGAGTLVWGTTVGSQIVGTLKFGSTTSAAVTTFENGVDLNGADRAINVDENTTVDALDYTVMPGTISNSGGTPAGFAKAGNGLLVLAPLSGGNAYNGDTVISGGALQANDGVGLPSGSLLKLDGGVLQADGFVPVTFTRGIGTSGTAVQWTANGGGFSAGNVAMNVRIGGNTNAVDWGDAPADIGSKIVGTLKFGSTTANAVTTFENGINLNGAVRTIQADHNGGSTAVNDWAVISGLIADGSAAGGITKTGAGTLVLSNVANSYTGVTTISAGTLEVPSFANAGSASPLGAPATTDAANLVIVGGSLRYSGTVAAATDRGFTTSGSARVENNTAEITFSGPIVSMPSTSFTKNSPGKLTFTNPGANTLATTTTSLYNGILEFNGGSASVYEIGKLNLGINTPSVTSVVYQKSGTVKGTTGSGDYWRMAGTSSLYPNTYAYYKLSGGTLDMGNFAPVVAYFGKCVFEQTSGDLTTMKSMYVGDQADSIGVYNLFGGTCTVDSDNTGDYLRIGPYGKNGVVNVGGTGLLTTYYVGFATASASAAGTLNLGTGGTVATRRVHVGTANGKGTLNFHGGTLQARVDSTDFIRNTATDVNLNAYIYQEGAVIDTPSGVEVTILKVLQTPEGAPGTVGVGGVTLSSVGAGYVGAPTVTISGSSTGSGATAIANVDLEPTSATYGQITGIVITNPGIGYDPLVDILTATLDGGGATTPAVPLAVTLNTTANVSGGLTKVGLGTLTLSADNTFTGQVKVKAGTLAVATINDGVAGPLGNSVLPVVLGDTGGVTGTLQFTGGGIVATTRKFTMADGGTGAIQMDAATNLTLSSEIDGNGGMSKSGDGTLTLTAANSYAGATTIGAGTLALTATGQIATSSSIANAATFNVLDGTHTVNAISGAGTTNVYGTATLTAPSIVQGTLTIGGVAPTAAGAVPEPSTIVLLVLAGLAVVGAYLRRK